MANEQKCALNPSNSRRCSGCNSCCVCVDYSHRVGGSDSFAKLSVCSSEGVDRGFGGDSVATVPDSSSQGGGGGIGVTATSVYSSARQSMTSSAICGSSRSLGCQDRMSSLLSLYSFSVFILVLSTSSASAASSSSTSLATTSGVIGRNGWSF
ncbi:unnamed protein product [Calypogeia fissa]